jgi:cobalt-zinc-cadmium efflux system outer membrane protein
MCVFTQCASKTALGRLVAFAGVFVVVCSVPARAQTAPIPARLSLADAVKLAIERNPAITEAVAGVDAAEADQVTAARRPNPAVSIDSEGYPLFEPNRPNLWGNQEFTIRYDQELETAGRRRIRTDLARTGQEIAQLELRDMQRQIELAARRAYLVAVLAEADKAVAQTALEEIDRVIALNRARFDQGEISGADLRRLQVERLRFVEDLFTADLAARNGRSALLAVLHAASLDQPLELTDGLAVSPGEMGALLADATAGTSGRQSLVAQALAARPDILGARQEQSLAETATRLQRALRTPNMTIGAGYRKSFGTNAIVFGATIPLPIFNRNQGGVMRADAERRAADARSAQVENAVRLDVQRTVNAVEVNRARVTYLENEYLTSARESRDIVLESYRLGVANLIDYLDAQRAFRDTQRTYNRALFDQRLSLFELAAAVGSDARRQ